MGSLKLILRGTKIAKDSNYHGHGKVIDAKVSNDTLNTKLNAAGRHQVSKPVVLSEN